MKPLIAVFSLSCLSILCFGQTNNSKKMTLTDSLCKNWNIDSIEIKESGMKFKVPENNKDNFMHFQNNMTFTSQEAGTIIHGKWKINIDKREILNYDIDNSELKNGVTLNIISLSKNKLAITSAPMSGNQIVLHYITK